MTPKQTLAASRTEQVRRLAGTMPLSAIAEKLHISTSTVSNIAFRNGISLGFRNRVWTPLDDERLIAFGETGVDWQTVGGHLNRTPDACRVRYGKLIKGEKR